MIAFRATIPVALFFLFLAAPRAAAAQVESLPISLDAPSAVLGGIEFTVEIEVPASLEGTPYGIRTADGRELLSGTLTAGVNTVEGVIVEARSDLPLTVAGPGFSAPVDPLVLPPWLSIVPPLLAIAFALIFREVVISLFAGIWLGALFVAGLDPLRATLITLDRFVLGALAGDADRVAIVVFSLLLGGMVGVVTRSGGTRGVVEALRPYATTARGGQLMTWFAGLIIFFDDYANTLIVGNTMRPVTDRLRVSREKLSYIVDSTAAPLAVIAPISTWVGFEISLIGGSLGTAAARATDPAVQASLAAGAANPFSVFLHSIPYLFYPILTVFFVFLVAVTRRDLGPMLVAERRAAAGGGVIRAGSAPLMDPSVHTAGVDTDEKHRWYNAIVPIAAVVVVAIAGIVFTGLESLGEGPHAAWDVVGAGNAFSALLWASFAGCVVAISMAVVQRVLSIGDAIEGWLSGMRAMMLAIVILVLAWGLGGVTEALGTGTYLADLLRDSLPVALLPVLVFIVAAATSFATGTSWGTMAILFPVVVPLAVAMGAGVGFDLGEEYTILLGAISSIMAGSIFGDHCSPISDTTVMSSMSSAVDHIDHVRTQLPYALIVAAVAMLVGDIPTALGLNPFVALAIGAVVLYIVLRLFGGRSDDVTDILPPREAAFVEERYERMELEIEAT